MLTAAAVLPLKCNADEVGVVINSFKSVQIIDPLFFFLVYKQQTANLDGYLNSFITQ
jgi:hypothetical protein